MAKTSNSIINLDQHQLLQEFSGNDGITEYYLDLDNSVSPKEAEYIRYFFGELSKITSHSFVETTNYESGILNIFSLDPYDAGLDGGDGYLENKDYWMDVVYANYEGDEISDYERWLILHEVGHAIGLEHPNGDDSHSDKSWNSSLTVMSDNEDSLYPITYRNLDDEALKKIFNSNSDYSYNPSEDPTLPALNTVEANGLIALYSDSKGAAFAKVADNPNILKITDSNGEQYDIEEENYKILAIDGSTYQAEVLWGLYDGKELASYEVWGYSLERYPDGGDQYYYESTDNPVDTYESGTRGFDSIAKKFGLQGDVKPQPPSDGTKEIHGTDQKDNLKGTKGSDHILGYGSSDKINGKKGDDLIDGGAWTSGKFDKTKGGKGSDTFVIKDEYWTFIKDFDLAEDRLDLSGLSAGYSWDIVKNKTFLYGVDDFEVARFKGALAIERLDII